MSQSIGQALRRIKKLKGRLAESSARASKAVYYLDETPPAFSFSSQRENIASLRTELIGLETAVAVANANTTIDLGGKKVCLAQAIRMLQELKADIAFFKGLRHIKSQKSGVKTENVTEYTPKGEYVSIEKKYPWTCVFTEQMQAQLTDRLNDEFEKVNNMLERANHNTTIELPESQG